jgi:rSAM/selenodomain-associated transferase 1
MARSRSRAPRRIHYANRLVIMAKSPIAGRVKRRLGCELGDVAAIRFYRASLSHTLQRLARDTRWRTVLAVDPDSSAADNVWPRGIARLTQGGGDLGRRMQRLLAILPPGPAIIIGSDIPAIRPTHVAQAFKLLGCADAVFGRAPDGGYWLVGLKRTPRVLAPFAGVRWSGPEALADTLANLRGKRVAYAATLSDVDTAEDFRRERVGGERLIGPRK